MKSKLIIKVLALMSLMIAVLIFSGYTLAVRNGISILNTSQMSTFIGSGTGCCAQYSGECQKCINETTKTASKKYNMGPSFYVCTAGSPSKECYNTYLECGVSDPEFDGGYYIWSYNYNCPIGIEADDFKSVGLTISPVGIGSPCS